MKKVRFSLLTKIILLTGMLTILTVATSLTVNLIISHKTTLKTYTSSCEGITDSIESTFYNENNDELAKQVFNVVIEKYEAVRDNYDSINETEYQEDVRVSLFGAANGSMGMSYQQTTQKNYFIDAVSNMQVLCSKNQVPFSSLILYDSEKECIINIASSEVTMEDNYGLIGLVEKGLNQKEIEFYEESSDSYSFMTYTQKDRLMSYNYVPIALSSANYKCFVVGGYLLEEINSSFNHQLIAQLIVTVASAVFLVVIYAILTKFFLLRNVEKLTDSTNKFVGMMKNDEPLEIIDNNVQTTDEIRELSDAFTLMQNQIITYVENIKEAKNIEQAFKMEVDIASHIQLESLPAKIHFDKNIELRAFIKPAKGVGGDFYDYFYIDKNHLAVVIADVSGKGIPASLFMMRAKESIRSASMNEKDLSKVLFKVNNSLCVNNKEGFFVTAFLGVLDLKTYQFNFASAGHERPYIKQNGQCERLVIKSNFVLGLEEDFIYETESIQLNEDDAIILYTDGLNEAINNKQEEFGYQRILESLQKDVEIKDNISTVINDLEQYIGEEEQFDDITILGFKIKKNTVSYSYLNPTYNDILDLTDKAEAYLEGIDPLVFSKIGVVIDEVMNNIISYGKTKTNKTLEVTIEKNGEGATLIFVDNSHPFNPLNKKNRTIPENMEQGITGGVGISIVKTISKEAEYSYSNNKNILIIKF